MRPVQIMDKPAAVPGVCIGCGSGNERQFFVDLGFDTKLEKIDEYNHTYFTEGVVYLCSECITSLIVEFNRKLAPFLLAQFTAKGFQMAANRDEVKMLQDEISMLRGRLNAVDAENQEMRYALQTRLEMENGVISPPVEPTGTSAEELVDKMLGKDETDGDTAGTADSTSDGRDSNSEGNDNDTKRDDSTGEPDSLTISHLVLGGFNISPEGS